MRFIIVGAGDVGISLAEHLTGTNQDVVLIERNEHHLSKIPPSVDAQIIHGNGCQSDVLVNANILKADFFLAVADNDEVNISACLMAKLLNPNAKRIARIRHLDFNHPEIKLHNLTEYFDLIINPDQAGANHLFRLLQAPGAIDVIQFVNGRLHAYGIEIGKNAPCHNVQIKDLAKKAKNIPLVIIAIIRDKKLIVPHGNDYLYSEDIIYAVTPIKYTQKLFDLAGQKNKETRKVMIWGGTILAHFLTKKLQAIGVKVKLILSEEQINEETLDHYPDSLVLQGEGTDQRILLEENVSDADAYIAASPDEEDNVLAALLAKKFGAHTVMALVNKRTYLDLVTKIGVDIVVSTQLAAALAISKYIHPETVLSDSGLNAYDTGFLEITAYPDLPYLGARISDFKLPTGVLFVALVRKNEIIIPKGTDIIEEYDKMIIFSRKNELKKLEKIMDIKIDMLK
jgi:trk system potassium uptake protein TrkA